MCRWCDEQPMLLEGVTPQDWICNICLEKLMNESEEADFDWNCYL